MLLILETVLDFHSVSLIQQRVFLNCSHRWLRQSLRDITANHNFSAPITLSVLWSPWGQQNQKCHISECYYIPSANMKMDTAVLLKWLLLPSTRVNGPILIQWSELSSLAHVSIPGRNENKRELFPFAQRIHRLELTCLVFSANHKWCSAAENQNTSCYS